MQKVLGEKDAQLLKELMGFNGISKDEDGKLSLFYNEGDKCVVINEEFIDDLKRIANKAISSYEVADHWLIKCLIDDIMNIMYFCVNNDCNGDDTDMFSETKNELKNRRSQLATCICEMEATIATVPLDSSTSDNLNSALTNLKKYKSSIE